MSRFRHEWTDEQLLTALRPALGPSTGPDLFSGHVERGMATALRDLADHIEPLEPDAVE